PLFDIQLVGKQKGHIQLDEMVWVECNKTIDEANDLDVLLIPAVQNHLLMQAVEDNAHFVPWLQKIHAKNVELGSLCIGAFVLASSGLLDGKKCSTHWSAAELFNQMFPKVELIPQYTITDYNGIYTSGGAFSFQNLILYLVEKYQGKEIAIWLAKMLVADMNKPSQLPFTIFNGVHHHDDAAILKAQKHIEEQFATIGNVGDIADQVLVPQRTFVRRFKKATHNTPIGYLQKVRIEATKKQLENSNKTVNEIMYDVGYSDIKSFRNLFKKHTGLSPQAYRKKFSIYMN
ncbi:MAG: helix-turn-helix domain-containing protein, partial [Bacteroidetes bacterium]|nr:helix-turn-helix domain-containing protein [Bacteroidota bacterium]